MTNLANSDFLPFWDLILKIWHTLERPVVQIQLLGIAVVLFLAWLAAQGIWFQWRKQISANNKLTFRCYELFCRKFPAASLRYILVPILGLIGITLLKNAFLYLGWSGGLMNQMSKILWLFLFYRALLLLGYVIFPETSIKKYRWQYFLPLLILSIAGIILNLFTDLAQAAQVAPIKLFGVPITLGAIFATTVGLYLWIVGWLLLENLLQLLLKVTTKLEARAVKASFLLIRYLIIGLGIVLIFGYVGFNATALAAITGGLSVGIGFGLREVIANFISGIWLLFEGALKPGDIITIEGKISEVKELGLRAASVQVIRDNSEKIIPNHLFFSEEFTTNRGSDLLVARHLRAKTSYQTNPQKVLNLLLQVAAQHPLVLKEPAPKSYVIDFGEFSLDFELKFWLDDPVIFKTVKSELICAIWNVFAENKIEIPYPQRDLRLRSDLWFEDQPKQ